jgi:hypothetical protein
MNLLLVLAMISLLAQESDWIDELLLGVGGGRVTSEPENVEARRRSPNSERARKRFDPMYQRHPPRIDGFAQLNSPTTDSRSKKPARTRRRCWLGQQTVPIHSCAKLPQY